MSKKLLFIVNPVSGKSHIKNDLLEVVNIFVKSGYSVSLYITQTTGDAKMHLLQNIDGYDLIVCSGGDGTLNEVVSAIIKADSSVKIGYIPTGTTNDFALSMGISRHIPTAAKVVVSGEPFSCDIGYFNGTNFLYVAAFGLFTNVSYTTSQNVKNTLGQLAYFLEGVKALSEIKSYYLDIEYNGVKISGDFMFGMITNSNSIGGFKNISAEKISLNDGLFEVIMIKKPNSFAEFRKLIIELLSFEGNSKYIHRFLTDSLNISCKENFAWTLDGEFGGNYDNVTIKNLKEAVTFIV